MSKHLLFILILAVCTNVFAQQTKSISGVVYDSNTGEALIGVSVLAMLFIKIHSRGTCCINVAGFFMLVLSFYMAVSYPHVGC